MPTVAYEVIVSVADEVAPDASVAIAEAARYLGYADQTDTFGYNGRVYETHAYGGDDGWGVALHFTAPIGLLRDKARFEGELDQLAHVESWAELSHEE